MARTPLSTLIIAAFLVNTFGPLPAQAQWGGVFLPTPGVRIALSPEFMPPILKGIVIHPENPLQFDFLIHKGDSLLPDDQKKEEYNKIIKYFLACLTIPEKDLWVNLSPYEKQRIIPQDFALTEMGRDLLSQDYTLKQITASLIYPEDEFGKKFWKRVYEEAAQKFGTTNIPVNTFNKVWIIPSEATVYEHENTVLIVHSKMKVMLEEDYLSLDKHSGIAGQSKNDNKAHTVASQVVREIVIPALEKEVNEGKNFALLRQINESLILATWYKKALKESLLGKVYVDKAKVKGVDQPDTVQNQKIYEQYLQAFKKGVFNYIKEEQDPLTQEVIPRKYFSGGYAAGQVDPTDGLVHNFSPATVNDDTILSNAEAVLGAQEIDRAMGTGAVERVTANLDPSGVRPENVSVGGKDYGLEFDVLMGDAIEREKRFDGFGPFNAREVIGAMEIRDIFLADEGPRHGKIYIVESVTGDRYLALVDSNQKLIRFAVDTRSGNNFHIVDMSPSSGWDTRFALLSRNLNPLFEAKIKPVLEQASRGERTIADRILEYGSVRFTDQQKANIFLPVINPYYDISDLRNDFINNSLVRHYIRRMGPKLVFAFGSTIRMIQVSRKFKPAAISFGGHTMYGMHSYRTMEAFPLHHRHNVTHEFSHEFFHKLDQGAAEDLSQYFTTQRSVLADTVRKGVSYAGLKEKGLADEVVAQIVGELTAGYTRVFMQDGNGYRYDALIKVNDIDMLTKHGFLPADFEPSAEERIRFQQSDGNIDEQYLARVYPQAADKAMVTKGDLLKIINEKAGMSIIGLMIAVSMQGYEFEDAFQNFDEELGVYVIPDEVMRVLGPIGGMPDGKAFNLLGHVALRASTVALIKSGSKDALYELRHEEAHNKYRTEHPEFPYQSPEQLLVDEVYAHLDGFITTFGRNELFEKRDIRFGQKDWFENVLSLLVNDYVGKDVEQRETIVRKLSYVIGIIKLVFQHKQDAKIMAYIKRATNLDEILGITPLEHQQWLIDAGIQPTNHESLREQWSQFNPDFAMKVSVKNVNDLGGIDLNSANLDLQIKRDGKGVPLPLQFQDMEKLQNIQGFVPVIINIVPVTSLPFLSEFKAKDRSIVVGAS